MGFKAFPELSSFNNAEITESFVAAIKKEGKWPQDETQIIESINKKIDLTSMTIKTEVHVPRGASPSR